MNATPGRNRTANNELSALFVDTVPELVEKVKSGSFRICNVKCSLAKHSTFFYEKK
jgi:hypothetical protein